MKKSLLAFVVVLSLICSPVYGTAQPKFTDISGHWAETLILKLAEAGIVNGVGNDKFLPDHKMSKSQFAALLHKALGIQIRYFRAPDITEVYRDVRNEDWFALQLYDLVTVGIIDDKVNFKPDTSLTREEMAHYIIKAYSYVIETDSALKNENIIVFTDEGDIKKEFRDDVREAVKFGLILGRSNNKFEPAENSTRAEVLIVIGRFMDMMPKKAVRK